MPPEAKKTIADHVIDLLTSRRGGLRPGQMHIALIEAGYCSAQTGLTTTLRGLIAKKLVVKSDKGVYTLPGDSPSDQPVSSMPGVKKAADHIFDLIASREGGWAHGEIHTAMIQAGHISSATGINPMLSGLLATGRVKRLAPGIYGLPGETHVPKARTATPGVKRISDHIVDLIATRSGGWTHGELLDRLVKEKRIAPGTGIAVHLKALVAQEILAHEHGGTYSLANEKPVVPAYDRPVETSDAASTREWPVDLKPEERAALHIVVTSAREVEGSFRIVRLRDRLASTLGTEDEIDDFIAEASARHLIAFVSDRPHEIHRVNPTLIRQML